MAAIKQSIKIYKSIVKKLEQLKAYLKLEYPEADRSLWEELAEQTEDYLAATIGNASGFCPCCGDEYISDEEEMVIDNGPFEIMNIGVEFDNEDEESRVRLNLYSQDTTLLDTTVWFDCKVEQVGEGVREHEVNSAFIEALRELADMVERRDKLSHEQG